MSTVRGATQLQGNQTGDFASQFLLNGSKGNSPSVDTVDYWPQPLPHSNSEKQDQAVVWPLQIFRLDFGYAGAPTQSPTRDHSSRRKSPLIPNNGILVTSPSRSGTPDDTNIR